MNINYDELQGENKFEILCRYAEELNEEVFENSFNEKAKKAFNKLMTFYDELNYSQRVIFLKKMLDLAEYFSIPQLNLLLKSKKLDEIDTSYIKPIFQNKELELFLTETTYHRNEIMTVVYEKIYGEKPLDNEINQWAGNHWDKVTDFFDKAFKLDMNEYKGGTLLYSIPIIDAIVIMAYTYLILNRELPKLIHKLENRNYTNINAYELDCFVKILTDLLKKECKRKLSMHIDSTVLNNNIKYVKDRMDRCIRNRDTERSYLASANKLLEKYYSDIEQADATFFQEHKFNEDVLLKKRKVVNILKLAYSNAFYEFLNNYYLEENKLIENNQGFNWTKNFGDDIYFDDHEQKWICEISIESASLIIPEYISDDDTLECKFDSEKNPESIIKNYYSSHIYKFDNQILSQPSKAISGSTHDVNEDLLKEILKHFNDAVKYGCRNLAREFCKQLKKI